MLKYSTRKSEFVLDTEVRREWEPPSVLGGVVCECGFRKVQTEHHAGSLEERRDRRQEDLFPYAFLT